MKAFDQLTEILESLLAPDGCPWDKEQTLQSMRKSLLEEAYEVIEAIDLDDNHKISEELGDLLFNVVFLSKLAEKERRFTLVDVLHEINTKLIRRHPHIFGDAVAENSEEVLRQWEEIKRKEKGIHHKKSVLDDIPKGLPSLARAHKMLSKFSKVGFPYPDHPNEKEIGNEEELGHALLKLVLEGREKGLDVEQALQKTLTDLGLKFKDWEHKKNEGSQGVSP